MALDDYSALKSAIADWMTRNDLTGNIPDWIKLAEARLNRTLGPVEVNSTLSGTIGQRTISVSALSVVEPLALFLVDPTISDEIELAPKAEGTYPRLDTPDRPRFWSLDGSVIGFDRPLDLNYSFRFRYRQRFALSDSAPTNWLLTNNPDLYLAASIVWGGGFVDDLNKAAAFKTILDEGIGEVRNIIARGKRAVLSVDDSLTALRFRHHYDGSY